jgi:hypothetical protein
MDRSEEVASIINSMLPEVSHRIYIVDAACARRTKATGQDRNVKATHNSKAINKRALRSKN